MPCLAFKSHLVANRFTRIACENWPFDRDTSSIVNPQRTLASNYLGIKEGCKRTVSFKPLFGLLNQPKWIPLKYAGGLVLELEIVNNFTDPIIDPATAFDSY